MEAISRRRPESAGDQGGDPEECPRDDRFARGRGRPGGAPVPGAGRDYGVRRSMRRLTARLNVQLGTTDECLPDPPATMTSTSSGLGTWGSLTESSVALFIHAGQSCIPHIPPSFRRRSGSRACSKTNRCTSSLLKPSAAIVAACSGPSTTRSWLCEKYQPTLEASVAAASATLLRIPGAVVET